MKTRLFSKIIILIILLFGCENEKSTKYGNIEIEATLLSFTSCNTAIKSTEIVTPSVRLTAQADGKLAVKMINTEFCCGTDSISLNKTIDSENINIEIIDNGPFTWCYCPHDIEFLLTSLENKDYKLTLIESEHSYSRDTFSIQFKYSGQLDTVIYSNVEPEINSQIHSVNTILGGCNTPHADPLKSAAEYTPDTVYFTIINEDTLNIFAGINYICCTPFEFETDIVNDTLIMTITDTCSAYLSCYCKCDCYYTWEFQYTDFEEKEYNFIVKLYNKSEEKTFFIKQGAIDLKNNLP